MYNVVCLTANQNYLISQMTGLTVARISNYRFSDKSINFFFLGGGGLPEKLLPCSINKVVIMRYLGFQ